MIERLAASADHRILIIEWVGGEASELAAETLRREARDAHSIRARLDHGAVHVVDGLTITHLAQVGRAAVNVHFSDGHDRAIYPFAYLRELSDQFGKKLTFAASQQGAD